MRSWFCVLHECWQMTRASCITIARGASRHDCVRTAKMLTAPQCSTGRVRPSALSGPERAPPYRRKEITMRRESEPNSDYTRTWSPSGEIDYATLADGTRLRYLKAGSGPALILLHTVRTQLDQFQLVIPKISHAFTVYAIDMPAWVGPTSLRARVTPSRRSAARSSSSSRGSSSKTSRWQASRWVRRCR